MPQPFAFEAADAPAAELGEGEPYSFSFTATGIPLPAIAVTGGELPTGLTLADTGELTGTPTVPGEYTFTVSATSTTGVAATGPYTVTVVPAGPVALAVTSVSLPGGWVDRPNSGFLTAVGGSGDYVWSVKGKLPTGLELNGETGAVSGTPTESGTFELTVAVADNVNDKSVKDGATVTLTVSDPPILVEPAKLKNAKVGREYNVTFTASGGTAPYSFEFEGERVMDGLVLGSGGALSGTPTLKGDYDFTVRVTDGDGAVGWRLYTLSIK